MVVQSETTGLLEGDDLAQVSSFPEIKEKRSLLQDAVHYGKSSASKSRSLEGVKGYVQVNTGNNDKTSGEDHVINIPPTQADAVYEHKPSTRQNQSLAYPDGHVQTDIGHQDKISTECDFIEIPPEQAGDLYKDTSSTRRSHSLAYPLGYVQSDIGYQDKTSREHDHREIPPEQADDEDTSGTRRKDSLSYPDNYVQNDIEHQDNTSSERVDRDVPPEQAGREWCENMPEYAGVNSSKSSTLSLKNVLDIGHESVRSVVVQCADDVPWHVLRKLMAFRRDARNTQLPRQDEDPQMSMDDWDLDEDLDNSEQNSSNSFHPLDVLCFLLNSSDPCLQQEILSKMSMCLFAVPLLLPAGNGTDYTFMLWALRGIVKRWRTQSLTGGKGFKEENVVDIAMPVFSFVRLGKCSLSKSRILNQLLSPAQQHHDSFVNREMEAGNVTRNISDGLVELTWYFPGSREHSDVFREPIEVTNLRGDLETNLKQFRFLRKVSSAVFIFIESISETQYEILSNTEDTDTVYFIIISPSCQGVSEETQKHINMLYPLLKINRNNILVKNRSVNDAELVKKLQAVIIDVINDSAKSTKLVDMADIARNFGFHVDERSEEHRKARKLTLEITGSIRDVVHYKKETMRLQGDLWKELSHLEKEMSRMRNQGDEDAENYRARLVKKCSEIRKKQHQQDLPEGIDRFQGAITQLTQTEKHYFIKWMKYNLDNIARKNVSALQAEYKEKCRSTGHNQQVLKNIDRQISESSLGIEHFLRELGQFYEAECAMIREKQSHSNNRQFSKLPGIAAELLLEGFPLELIDGDASNIPLQWVTDVLNELDTKTGGRCRMRVITVLGVQSTGKSTLLNTMFGLQFSVASGRCTRGAFMTLIKVKDDFQEELGCDFILVIDTEGLKAPELASLEGSYEHDNELATLVVGLSDITIINMAMENTTEMKDILQLVVHAFLRMNEIGKKPNCQFVHQNVSDISAHDKNMRDRKKFMEQLNEMTKVAARVEQKIHVTKFSDIIEHDPEKHTWYIPGFWYGVPPMASVSSGYSDNVYELKSYLLTYMGQMGGKPQTIREFIEWIKSLWNAVKHEKFIFSFRNSLVTEAYNQLCIEYSEWEWKFQKEIHNWFTGVETLIKNLTEDQMQVETWERIQRDMSQMLTKEEQIMFESLQEFYTSGCEYAHLLDNFRGDFFRSVNYFRKTQEVSLAKKCEEIFHMQRDKCKIQNIQEKYLDLIEGKVKYIIETSRRNKWDLNDDRLKEEFEDIWENTLSAIKMSNQEKLSIENLRLEYFSTFETIYKEKNECQKRAKHYCELCLKPAITEHIQRRIGKELVEDILYRENSREFKSQTAFQFTVLEGLLKNKSFDQYVEYINDYESFVKKWILGYVTHKYNNMNSIYILQNHILTSVMEKVRRTLGHHSVKQSQNVPDLLSHICNLLNKELVFSKNDLKVIAFQNTLNISQFLDDIKFFLDDTEKQMKTEMKDCTIEYILSNSSLKPQDELFKKVFGCGKRCPFCKVPCEAGAENHKEHFASVHRPKGLGQYRNEHTHVLDHSICSTDVVSNKSFSNAETGWKPHPYKEYRIYYPDWIIYPEMNISASDYWKFVFKEFNQHFARRYNDTPADLPEDWHSITQEKALLSLKESYVIIFIIITRIIIVVITIIIHIIVIIICCIIIICIIIIHVIIMIRIIIMTRTIIICIIIIVHIISRSTAASLTLLVQQHISPARELEEKKFPVEEVSHMASKYEDLISLLLLSHGKTLGLGEYECVEDRHGHLLNVPEEPATQTFLGHLDNMPQAPPTSTLPEHLPQAPPMCSLPEHVPQGPPMSSLPEHLPQAPPMSSLPEHVPQGPPMSSLPEHLPQAPPMSSLPEHMPWDPPMSSLPEHLPWDPPMSSLPEHMPWDPPMSSLPEHLPWDPPMSSLPEHVPQDPPMSSLPEHLPQAPPMSSLPEHVPWDPPMSSLPEHLPWDPPKSSLPEHLPWDPPMSSLPQHVPQDPSMSSLPEHLPQDPSMSNLPEHMPQAPPLSSLPEHVSQTSPVCSLPEHVPQDPPMSSLPEHVPQTPPMSSLPEHLPQAPSMSNLPEHIAQAPPVSSLPENLPQAPPMSSLPEYLPQAPLMPSLPEHALQTPPTSSLPEHLPQDPLLSSFAEHVPQGPTMYSLPEQVPQAPSMSSLPEHVPQTPPMSSLPDHMLQAPPGSNLPEHTIRNKRKIFEEKLKQLHMEKFRRSKLSLLDVLEIGRESVMKISLQRVDDVPWHFLQNLMALNGMARNTRLNQSAVDERSDADQEEDVDFLGETGSSKSIHPLDLLCIIFHCSDSFLIQEIVLKMSMCQFAVPLLLPGGDGPDCTFMLWAMRDIVKRWRPRSLADSKGCREDSLVHIPMPTFSFVRLGKCHLSKSSILNHILSPVQQHHDFFVHENMEGGNILREMSDGLVEISWYFPGGRENSDLFPEPVAVTNLRGDLASNWKQFTFLTQMSTAVFIFAESINEREYDVLANTEDTDTNYFFIIAPSTQCVSEETQKHIKLLYSLLKINRKNILVKNCSVNDAELVKKIQLIIADLMNNSQNLMSLEEMSQIAKECGFAIDESSEEHQNARELAWEITTSIKDVVQYKKETMILQGDLWKQIAQIEKEICRMKKQGNENADHYRGRLVKKCSELRKKQRQHDFPEGMVKFISAITQLTQMQKHFFLKWMRFYLDSIGRCHLGELQVQYKETCYSLSTNHDKLKELDQRLSNSSLGVEHFLRELGQFYEAENSIENGGNKGKIQTQFSKLPGIAAGLLLDGFPLELIDGDASNIPLQWVTDVLTELDTKTGGRCRMRVITVLGVQSTGKSTLLNTMFGLQFPVASGRCTRGAFMTLIKVKDDFQEELGCDFILVIDTEGLKAPELASLEDSYEHDNELATLVVGLSDITIINMAMENTTEMKDILQIVVHAFLRMREIGKKPNCQFVHQNVSDVSAHDKNMRDRQKLLEQLDEMTRVASRMEEKSTITKFSDIMDYDLEEHSWYIPGLWHGVPPMASVNTGYSENIFELKKHLFKIIKKQMDYRSPQNICEFQKWWKSLWNAVKHEKFIFSFRNSLVAEAYNQLAVKYSELEWNFRKKMHNWMIETENEIRNHTATEVETEISTDIKYNMFCVLQEEEKIMSDSLEKYFESGQKHVALIERYRAEFFSSVKSLRNELEDYLSNKCEVAILIQKGKYEIQSVQEKYVKAIEERAISLLENCRSMKHQLRDDELESEFEAMWNETLAGLHLSSLKRHNVNQAMLEQLRRDMRNKAGYVNEKLSHVKSLAEYDQNGLDLDNRYTQSSWYINIPETFHNEYWNKVRDLVTSIQDRCNKYVTEDVNIASDFDQTYCQELLNIINEQLSQDDVKNLHLTPLFELDLKLHILGKAAPIFQKIDNSFFQENNPKFYLEKLKPQYLSTFKSIYHEKDESLIRAKRFSETCLKPALSDCMYRNLGGKIVDDILMSGDSMRYSSRTFFQFTLLKELLESSVFTQYVKYNNHYETFVKNWIMKYIIDKYKDSTALESLKWNVLSSITRKIRGVLKHPKVVESSSASECLKTFCEMLKKDLVISKNKMKVIVFQNSASARQFSADIETFLDDLETQISTEMNNFTIESVLSKVALKPQNELFKKVFGCGKQCPFCKVPCEAGGADHKEHFASVHRPQGLGTYRCTETKTLSHSICTTDVVGNGTFQSSDTEWKPHPYKDYRKLYPNWTIQPDPTIGASDYWKFVFKEFNQQFAELYNAKPANLEEDWYNITREQALQSLQESFNMA
ncbi:uncharacterized protein WCC33_013249 [Rhinophrynus dorsalis]